MYQDAFDALNQLGLKRNEAKVYLACLQNRGGLFVHEITKLSGIKRSTVDQIIRRLLTRHFLSSFREGPRRKFVAEAPERVLFDFQRGLDDFRTIIPKLMTMGTNSEQTRVTFHEGAQSLKAVYADIIMTLKNLPDDERVNYCISSGRDVERVYPRWQKHYVNQRIKNRIPTRMITIDKNAGAPWIDKELRTVRLFDGQKYPFAIEAYIAHDKVLLISVTRPIGGIVIQNKPIAHSLRSLFHLLWDMLGRDALAPAKGGKRGKKKTPYRPMG